MTAKAGLGDPTSKSLGVTVIDIDGDGWPDLFVSNDTQPNKLYRNNQNGTFTDNGMTAGVAYGEDGVARGAMGVDWADYDRTGRAHLLVGNFSNQMLGLYHNEGNGLFVDEAPVFERWPREPFVAGVRRVLLRLRSGRLPRYSGRQRTHRGRNRPRAAEDSLSGAASAVPQSGRQEVRERVDQVGEDFTKPLVARGAIYGDFDHDGDLDVLLTSNSGPAHLFRNDGGNKNHWLSVSTVGTKSNRDGIGAVVRIESASGKQWNTVRSGSSYASQSDLALTFGLGQDPMSRPFRSNGPAERSRSSPTCSRISRLLSTKPKVSCRQLSEPTLGASVLSRADR